MVLSAASRLEVRQKCQTQVCGWKCLALVAVRCSTAVWIVYRHVCYSDGSAGSSGWAGDVMSFTSGGRSSAHV